MSMNYWKDGVNGIIKHVLNGKRTIQQAKFYMDDNYIIGDSTKAFKHQAFEATSNDTHNELKAYNLLNDAIKLGHGNDKSFEIVFR
jgi:hypothetical protein